MTLKLDNMNEVAEAMVFPGKGILAADESTGTIGKRFDQINTCLLYTSPSPRDS